MALNLAVGKLIFIIKDRTRIVNNVIIYSIQSVEFIMLGETSQALKDNTHNHSKWNIKKFILQKLQYSGYHRIESSRKNGERLTKTN